MASEPVASESDLIAAMRAGMAVAWWAARDPDRAAVIAPTGDLTFAQLNDDANRLCRALRAAGLERDGSVAIVCSNRAEFAVTWAACWRGGFRLTTVNWHLTPDEAAYIVRDCGAEALVADATHRTAVPPSNEVALRLAVGGEIAGFHDWRTVLDREDASDIDDPCLGTAMLYTSGTTGYPKGVRKPIDPDGYIATALQYAYVDGDMHLLTGPLYHAAPLAVSLMPPLSCGVPVVMMPRWDPATTLALVAEHGITHTHMVPTMFHRLLALPESVRNAYDLSSLKGIVHGAAPCPVDVKRAMIEWVGPVLYEYYAATEGYGTGVDSRTWLTKPGTVGPVDPEKVYVGDDEGGRLPVGDEGLIWIEAKGQQRFRYFGDDAKTDGAYRGDYFTLGDVGRVDDDGYLYLTDRSANLVISGGVNIYPAEVDAVLLTHPAVADAGAIGVPDPEWGETLLAVVELKPGVSSDGLSDELIAWCRARLAHFKCPKAVDFVDRLPRDDNGKLYKRRLRDQYRQRGGDPSAPN